MFSKKFLVNVGYAFIAQIISLCLSIAMSLIIPKILGEMEFAYWQLFLFYSNYVGLFHIGLTDGVYLKYGGTEYGKLDKKDAGFQLKVLFCWLLTVTLIISFFFFFMNIQPERKAIILLTGIFMIASDTMWYMGYIFQATNRIKNYSVAIMIDKILFLLIVLCILWVGKSKYILLIWAYIVTKIIAVIYSAVNLKEIIFIRTYKIKTHIKTTVDYMKSGIFLTLSGVSGLLILGIGRFIIDLLWGIETFSKVSFALSLTNFFLLFTGQLSIVLFPTLRMVNDKQQTSFYCKCRKILAIFLPCILILYIPIKSLLLLWLPHYEMSLNYLALLLPLCILDGKMQLLCNTYFKVLRKERFLFIINVSAMLLSLLLSIAGGWIFKSMDFIIVGFVVSIAFRSILSELYLNSLVNGKSHIGMETAMEILLISVFMYVNWFWQGGTAFAVTAAFYLLYLLCIGKGVKLDQIWFP